MRGPQSRSFGWLATVLVVTTTLIAPWPALAQDATPATAGEATVSLTREEFQTQLQEDLQYTEAATPGGTFIDSSLSDIQTLQPLLVEEITTSTVVGQIYETLVGGDVRTGQIAPNQLADYWEVGADGRTYTFHLNQDATWHDGTDFTAQDVVFSADALANSDAGSVYTGSFVDTFDSWRAIDDDTFELVAKEPTYTALFEILSFYIIPRHLWESVPLTEWRTDPGATGTDPSRVVGTGPFKFREWIQGDSVTLDRNDDYYGKVPYLDSYVLRVWPEQTALVNALINGEVDVAALEAADVAALQGNPDIVVAEYPTRSFAYYEFNLDPEVTTMWQDERVRQALLYALDRESIVNDILLGYAEVAQGTQPVVSYAYAPDQIETNYGYDPEQAAALLEEAGWTDTDGDGIVDKDGEAMSFEFLYPQGSAETEQIVAYMQDAWSQIGVDATPRALEFPALIEATTTNPTFDIALYGFLWDASFIQDIMFGCAQYQVGFNDMKYCNEALDAINAEAKLTFDEDARRELLIQASNIVNDEQPIAVLHFSDALVGINAAIQNYIPSTWGQDLTQIWIQQ
jgi:peptide/nickel transport system substrate-binding protein